MKKGHKILLRIGIAVVIFLISFTIVTKIVVGSTKTAYLHIEEGTVEVNQGNGWVKATEGMDLSKKDSVRTLDGKATIVLYESSFINLEPNTEVSIESLSKSNTKTKQESGTTWNKFTKVTGMDNYEVETPNTVATIRGTEFMIDADKEAIIVIEGVVDFTAGGKTVQVKAFEKYALIDGELQKQELTAEERANILGATKENLERLKRVRLERMSRMKVIDWVRDKYTIEEGKDMSKTEQLTAFFDSVDKEQVSDRDIMTKAPIINKHPAAKMFIAFNDEIKQNQDRIRNLEGKQKEVFQEVDVDVTEENVVTIETE